MVVFRVEMRWSQGSPPRPSSGGGSAPDVGLDLASPGPGGVPLARGASPGSARPRGSVPGPTTWQGALGAMRTPLVTAPMGPMGQGGPGSARSLPSFGTARSGCCDAPRPPGRPGRPRVARGADGRSLGGACPQRPRTGPTALECRHLAEMWGTRMAGCWGTAAQPHPATRWCWGDCWTRPDRRRGYRGMCRRLMGDRVTPPPGRIGLPNRL